MKQRIINKQNNSRHCVVCGNCNQFGLNGRFYDLENGEVVGFVNTRDWHQSYPGRVHGGMTAAMLDEIIARAMWVSEPTSWSVTASLDVKYKLPIPTDATLKIIGRVTRNSRKIFEGEGIVYLENGLVAAIGKGKYLKMPAGEIADEAYLDTDWYLIDGEADPEEVEIP